MKFKDKTRGEYPLTLYTTEGGGDRPVHGRIVIESGEVRVLDWPANGRYRPSGESHPYDLLPLREPSRAAVEAADKTFWAQDEGDLVDMRRALTAAYAIDFPEGGE